MKSLKIAILMCIAILMSSCGPRKQLIATAEQLCEHIKNGTIDSLTQIYPDIPKKENFLSFDSYSVTEIEEINKDSIKVKLSLQSTNRLGDQLTNGAVLYMSRLREPKYIYGGKFDSVANDYVDYIVDSILPGKVIITDSKGFYEIDRNDPIYKYAVNTGCITAADTTDRAVLGNLRASVWMLLDQTYSALENIENNLSVTQWSWDSSDYSDSASGDGICKNNSDFTVSHPRYKVTFLDRYGNVITAEEGEIADKLLPGKYKSFSFYTSYAPRAMRARIAVDFDRDAIYEALLTADYDGTEYQKYLQPNL